METGKKEKLGKYTLEASLAVASPFSFYAARRGDSRFLLVERRGHGVEAKEEPQGKEQAQGEGETEKGGAQPKTEEWIQHCLNDLALLKETGIFDEPFSVSLRESFKDGNSFCYLFDPVQGIPMEKLLDMSHHPLTDEKSSQWGIALTHIAENLMGKGCFPDPPEEFFKRLLITGEGELVLLPLLLLPLVGIAPPFPQLKKREARTEPGHARAESPEAPPELDQRWVGLLGSILFLFATKKAYDGGDLSLSLASVSEELAGVITSALTTETTQLTTGRLYQLLNHVLLKEKLAKIPPPPPSLLGGIRTRLKVGYYTAGYSIMNLWRSRLLSPLYLFRSLSRPVWKVVRLTLLFLAFLLVQAATFWWTVVNNFPRWIIRSYHKLRRLTWKDLKEFWILQVREAREGIRQRIILFKKTLMDLRRVNEYQLMLFTRHLGVMLNAGLPLTRAIAVLGRDTPDKKLKATLQTVNHALLEHGVSLSAAMAKFPRVFDEAYVNMLIAGEVTGKLGDVLGKISELLDKSLALKRKVKGAMVYPAMILLASVGVFSIFAFYVLPTYMAVFKSLNVRLPLPTILLIQLVDFLHDPLRVIFFVLLFLFFSIPLLVYARSIIGSRRYDLLKLQSPLWGPVYKKVILARLCRTFGSLFNCGVSMIHALEVTGRAVANEFVRGEITEMIESIKAGVSLHDAMIEIPFFPPVAGGMVKVGEETGSLPTTLDSLANYYEFDVDRSLAAFVTLIEPVLMIIMGVVVCFVVMGVFLPLYSVLRGIA